MDQNDLPFRATFPYLALAQSGQAHTHLTVTQERTHLTTKSLARTEKTNALVSSSALTKDPSADTMDAYVFISPENANNVVLAASYIPFENPENGPNYYEWDSSALYDIYVDNNGDAKPDITYTLSSRISLANPSTFLYNTGPISTLTDANWNRREYISVTETSKAGVVTLITNKLIAPVNIGNKSTGELCGVGRCSDLWVQYAARARQAICWADRRPDLDGHAVFRFADVPRAGAANGL